VVTPVTTPPRAAATPEPRQGSRTGTFIKWIVFIAIVVGAYYAYRAYTAASTAAAPTTAPSARLAPLVVAVPVRTADRPIYISAIGTVQPLYNVTIHTRVNGPIVKINFEEGQTVKAGDPLVDIDPRPFQVQVDQAQGTLDRDTSILAGAQSDLERYQTATPGTVPQQTIADQKALVGQDTGTVEQDKAALDNAKLQLSFCHITSPVTGVIGLRLIDLGDIVQTTDATGLAVVTTIQPITVVFPVRQSDISRVIAAQHADPNTPLPVQVFDQGGDNFLATGGLLAMDNQVNPATAQVQVKATFENKDFKLFPGMFVKPRLLVDTLRNKQIIPTAARQTGPDGTPFVFVITDSKPMQPGGKLFSGVAHLRSITTEDEQADTVVADTGLKPGDLVVTDGVDKLQDGSPVQYSTADAATTAPSGRGARGGRGARSGANPVSAPATNNSAPANP
jgi:multidrug efflux system membrane fusion protein